MVDMALIGGVANSLNVALNISKALLGIRDQALIQEKVVELLSVITTAHQANMAGHLAQLALVDRVRELEQQIIAMKDWGAEKQRYQLEKLPHSGAFAYSVKPGMEAGEPPHWICATCYQDGKKSVLQSEVRHPGRSLVLICNTCCSDIYEAGARFPDHPKISPRRTRAV